MKLGKLFSCYFDFGSFVGWLCVAIHSGLWRLRLIIALSPHHRSEVLLTESWYTERW